MAEFNSAPGQLAPGQDPDYDAGHPTDDSQSEIFGHPSITPPTCAVPVLGFSLKNGDTLPALVVVLKDAIGPINLSGATVEFKMQDRQTKRPVLTERRFAKVADDPTTGQVAYQWVSGETDDPNFYEVEFLIAFDDNNRLTCPDDGYLPITIQAAIPTVAASG